MSPEQLALLVKTEWQLSYVTPLHQFRHTQLKSYSGRLSAFIAAEKQRGLAVEVEGPQGNFRVSFSVVQGMVEAGDDAETVLIQVITGLRRGDLNCGLSALIQILNPLGIADIFTHSSLIGEIARTSGVVNSTEFAKRA